MDNWIEVWYDGNGFYNNTIYVNPLTEQAKLVVYSCTYCSHHDEVSDSESEYLITIESALRRVYPDEKAIALILSNVRGDYSETLKLLAEENRRNG